MFPPLLAFLPLLVKTLAKSPEEHSSDVDSGLKQCSELLIGQYLCAEPEVDPDTQNIQGCSKESNTAHVWCSPAPDVNCKGLQQNGTFAKSVPCHWTNGQSFETALLLSIFLGMFGVDRFYLGYPALGLLKFSTLGFMFLGQLVDILLIATQVVTPSDGSSYVLDYYGASVERIYTNNETYLVPGD